MLPATRDGKKQRRQGGLLTFFVSLALAAALGVVLWLVTSSLPYFAATPTGDPTLGPLNQCLLGALEGARAGFAVSSDAAQLAGFSSGSLAVCSASGARRFPLAGTTAAAWDLQGVLWLARAVPPEGAAQLWRLGEAGPERVGDLAPVRLVGTARGVVVLEASGRLVSAHGDGALGGLAQLPRPPGRDAQLSASADGERVAVVAGTGVFLYRSDTLALVRAEGPCDVQTLWWRPEGHRVLLACAPDFFIDLEVDTGEREAASSSARTPSTLLPRVGFYVEACDQLPCRTPAP